MPNIPYSPNKDARPALFVGLRERRFLDHIQSEINENIVKQEIKYYKIDYESSKFDDIYHEAKTKMVTCVYEMYAIVRVGDVNVERARFGSDRKQVIDVHIQQRRAYDDFDGFHARIGDFIEFDDKIFEIFSAVDDVPRYGMPDMKLNISVQGYLVRQNNFKFSDGVSHVDMRVQ